MKKIIGSRQAAELARKKFGDRAGIYRSDKICRVLVKVAPSFYLVKGIGHSWAEALKNAGIEIPQSESPDRSSKLYMDTFPTDTDAKEPDYGNE